MRLILTFGVFLLIAAIEGEKLQCYVCTDCEEGFEDKKDTCSGPGSGDGSGEESGSGSGSGEESGSGSGSGEESGSGSGSGEESGSGSGSGEESGSGSGSGEESGSGSGSGEESGSGSGSGEESGSGSGSGEESGSGSGSGEESGSGSGSGEESGNGSGSGEESGSGSGSGEESGNGSGSGEESGSGSGSGEESGSGNGSGEESGSGNGSSGSSGDGSGKESEDDDSVNHFENTAFYSVQMADTNRENTISRKALIRFARATRNNDTLQARCVVTSYEENNVTKIKRGCAYGAGSDTQKCQFLIGKNYTGTPARCTVCEENFCNAAYRSFGLFHLEFAIITLVIGVVVNV